MTTTAENTFSMAQFRSKSLFLPHDLRQVLRNGVQGGPPVLGYAVFVNSAQQIRSVAALGFDFVWLDPEHSSMNVETLTELIHTVSFVNEGRSTAVVRVPGHGHEWIASALDAGAGGVMVPQVDTAEQAKNICSSATYGAKDGGTRSVPPFRLIRDVTDLVPEGKTVIDVWNENVAIIAQIESRELTVSLSVPKFFLFSPSDPSSDGHRHTWIGHLDLRVSMGLPVERGPVVEPEYVAAVKKVHDAAKKYGKAIGGSAFPPRMEDKGKEHHFLLISGDALHLRQDAKTLAEARSIFQSPALERQQMPI